MERTYLIVLFLLVLLGIESHSMHRLFKRQFATMIITKRPDIFASKTRNYTSCPLKLREKLASKPQKIHIHKTVTIDTISSLCKDLDTLDALACTDNENNNCNKYGGAYSYYALTLKELCTKLIHDGTIETNEYEESSFILRENGNYRPKEARELAKCADSITAKFSRVILDTTEYDTFNK